MGSCVRKVFRYEFGIIYNSNCKRGAIWKEVKAEHITLSKLQEETSIDVIMYDEEVPISFAIRTL